MNHLPGVNACCLDFHGACTGSAACASVWNFFKVIVGASSFDSLRGGLFALHCIAFSKLQSRSLFDLARNPNHLV